MDTQTYKPVGSLAQRAIGDLVMAELFLVQATIESASALGEGISGLREQLSRDATRDAPKEAFVEFLKRTREEVTEPYATRFKFLRKIVSEDLDTI